MSRIFSKKIFIRVGLNKKNYLEIKERRKNPSIPKINKININKNIDSPYLSNFTFYKNCEKIVENGFSFGRTLKFSRSSPGGEGTAGKQFLMPDGLVSRWFEPQSRAGNTARTIALYHHRVWSWSVYLGSAYDPSFPSTPSENFTLRTLHSMTQRRHEISYSRKKMKKKLYFFTLFSFLSSFLPQLFSLR